MIPPPAIPDKPVVRVVHPSGHLSGHLDALRLGLSRLESAGCEVRWDPSAAQRSWRGYLAGDDSSRTKELCAAFDEDDVDIVWAARGGSGMNRIISPVVDHLRTKRPKVVVGFSDITALLNSIAVHLGWITFHGPVITTLGREHSQHDIGSLLSVLRGTRQTVDFPVQPHQQSIVEGRLMGGNLTVLASMMGSTLDAENASGVIWLMEDVGEAPYRLDRSFWQLKQAGIIDECSAIWFGDLDMDTDQTAQVIDSLAIDAGVPVIRGAPAGHRGHMDLLPIGGRVRIEPQSGKLHAVTPWVAHYEE
jgi:muramoyltetrapeptide carboxypeptidase